MRNVITVGVGVGEIIFGMTESNIIQILGIPDAKEKRSYLKNEFRIIYKYMSIGIELSFDSDDDYRLISIDINDSRYLIGEEGSIIDLSLNVILRIFETKGYSTPTIDCISNEYEPNHLMLYYDKESITISLINYICDSFSIGPLWKNEEEILWPPDVRSVQKN